MKVVHGFGWDLCAFLIVLVEGYLLVAVKIRLKRENRVNEEFGVSREIAIFMYCRLILSLNFVLR